MSVLADKNIIELVKRNPDLIRPFDKKLVEPASYDVTLFPEFLVFMLHSMAAIDVKQPIDHLMTKVECWNNNAFVLHPQGFAVACTEQSVCLPNNVIARIEGKSSLARLGLFVHSAGFIDPGYRGQITLELSNASPLPIILYPHMTIAQISFQFTVESSDKPYGSDDNSKYQNSIGPVASRYWRNYSE